MATGPERQVFQSQMQCEEEFSGSESPRGSDQESSSGSEDEAPRPMVRGRAVIVRGPARPDLAVYFAPYNMPPKAQVDVCRTYANWLSAEIRAQTGTVPVPKTRAPATRGRVSWAHGGTYKKRAKRESDDQRFEGHDE